MIVASEREEYQRAVFLNKERARVKSKGVENIARGE